MVEDRIAETQEEIALEVLEAQIAEEEKTRALMESLGKMLICCASCKSKNNK